MKKLLSFIPFMLPSVSLMLIALLLLGSCQEEEEIHSEPPQEETIVPGSELANLLSDVSGRDGSSDDLIDQTSCSSIQFPFTVVVQGIEITVDSEEDLVLLIELLESLPGEIPEIMFPITIILSDYSTSVIENMEQLQEFVDSCEVDETTDCVNFVYPISFSIFNTDFEVIDTVVIENDEDLYLFLQSLEDGANGVVLASLNFPVTLIYANGESIEVNTNEALSEAIQAAVENCADDDENDCDAESVYGFLNECFWYPALYDGSTLFRFTHFTFNEDGTVHVTNATNSGVSVTPLYEIIEDGPITSLIFSGTQAPVFEEFNGFWELLECSEDQITMQHNSGVVMVLQRDCGLDFAGCFGGGEAACDDDNDGEVTVDLGALYEATDCSDASEYVVDWYITFEDAYNQVNPLPSVYTFPVPDPEIRLYYVFTSTSTGEILYIDSYFFESTSCEDACDNPIVLTEDLVIYVPFGSEAKELISGTDLLWDNFTEDRSGNPTCAVPFVMNDDFVQIPITDANRIEQGDAFTVSFWFKMQNDELADLEVLFSKGVNFNEGFQLAVYDLNTPLFSDSSNGYGLWDEDWNQEIDVEWDNQDWHHLAVTVDATNTVKLYRDGVLRNMDENSSIDIGSGNESSYFINTQNFRGHFDDLRVYKRALNTNEIDSLFNLEGDCFQCF